MICKAKTFIACLVAIAALLLITRLPAEAQSYRQRTNMLIQIMDAEKNLNNDNLAEAEKFAEEIEKTVSPEDLDLAQSFILSIAEKYLEASNIEKAEKLTQKVAETAAKRFQEDLESRGVIGMGMTSGWNLTRVEFLEARILQKKERYLEAIEAFGRVAPRTGCGNGMAEVTVGKQTGIAECCARLGRYKEAYLLYFDSLLDPLYLPSKAKIVTDIESVRKMLSDAEKADVDEKAREQLIEYFKRSSLSEITTSLKNRAISIDGGGGYILAEAQRLGVLKASAKAAKKRNIAVNLDKNRRYKEAYLAYLDCLDIPWPYKDARPVEALERLKDKLSDAEKAEIDAAATGKLQELIREKHPEKRMESFVVVDRDVSDCGSFCVIPEDVLYLFILKEAKRLGLDMSLTEPEMKLGIAFYYWKTGKCTDAYLSYLDCFDIPWPYEDAEPVEALKKIRNGIDEHDTSLIDEMAAAVFGEALKREGLRETMELYAGLGPGGVKIHYPESVVYPFILAETKRLDLH